MTAEELQASELNKAKQLLKQAYSILEKFDYEPSDADEPCSLFSGEVSEDWFFYTKNGIEKFISNK